MTHSFPTRRSSDLIVDVHTIGAGGGSIARINDAATLQGGPEIAGATLGTKNYSRGGERVTITDANLALGRLNPKGLLAVERPVPMARLRAMVMIQVRTLARSGSYSGARCQTSRKTC